MTFVDPQSAAREIMDDFARSTGLSSDRPPRRYLWTDAFAVYNYLGLAAATGLERYRRLALDLVDQVHRVLGRHRDDDPRAGWISGLSEEEGARRPTAGGLRIGKPLPERGPDEPLDPSKEWDRDGQYFHYLTRWMHALNRAWRVTRDATFHRWAVELAEAALRGFLTTDGDRERVYWKMSIDLSRPLVLSTGQHDPLDGFVVLSTLQEAAPADSGAAGLGPEVRDLREMCRGASWTTDDPLGAGGLLTHALRLTRLRASGRLTDEAFVRTVLDDAVASLESVLDTGVFESAAARRLAFRELGLSIGLAAAERMIREVPDTAAGGGSVLTSERIRRLERGLPLRDRIEEFWTDPSHRRVEGWSGHRDISRVMLATSLTPSGFLGS